MAERTKLWIAAAMKRLMAKKSIDEIRVTELCREAEIQRPTFYYHFRDKYELVAWMFCHSAFETDGICCKGHEPDEAGLSLLQAGL